MISKNFRKIQMNNFVLAIFLKIIFSRNIIKTDGVMVYIVIEIVGSHWLCVKDAIIKAPRHSVA